MHLNEAGFQAVKRVLEMSGTLEMKGKGTSMHPLIREGEMCLFTILMDVNVKVGDIYLYRDGENRLITHRLIGQSGELLFFKGDANLGVDPAVKIDEVLAKLVRVKKNHKWVNPSSFPWRSFGKLLMTSKAFRKINVRFSKRTA
ncbi:S24/S26 family peptidase [Jeotgalibacillus aurantiacus]|uniref:S24/S26 family peptidase n=1 Tax=Jeotgalibacillus aurantiacus TaxID=2763266 RepID=UPI001D0B6DDB|nr:S24/S26 family peptidase [Jeotgalibacillus aurantiacus]